MGLRQQRLADEIRDLLAISFSGGQIQDPRLGGVTITAVKVSSDLQIATVYFRLISETGKVEKGDIETAGQGLVSASGFLRKRLAEHLDIRRIPALRFFYDESVEHGARIEHLLQSLKNESD